MATCKPTEISEAVTKHENDTVALRKRMDEDYALWRNDEYKGEDPLDGFRKFTSNEPVTFARKAISILSNAALLIQIPPDTSARRERDDDANKERFAIGSLKANDERLRRLSMPPLLSVASWQGAIRGWIAARWVIAKRKDGSSFTDISPLDPRNLFWQMGPDGLKWVVYRFELTPDEIKDRYGVRKLTSSNGGPADAPMTIYDYYDAEDHSICTGEQVLQRAQPHGATGRPPIVLTPIGPAPMVFSDQADDEIRDWGESIFVADRRIYNEMNFELSAMSEFVERSLKRPYVLYSADGTKALEENPWLSGTEVPLTINQDKLEVPPLMEMARETGALLGIMQGQMQRGSFPFSAYGELPFQLSGFAITQLRQGMTTVVQPIVQGLESFYAEGINLLVEQYISGAFPAMTFKGRDRKQEPFDLEITPEVVQRGGEIELELRAQLPEDDVGKMAMAQQARDASSGMPLLGDRAVREKYLGIQDTDLAESEVLEQMAKRAAPLPAAFHMMMAAAERGEQETAQMWQWEMTIQYYQQLLRLKQMLSAAQGIGGPAAGGAQGGNGSAPAARPGLMPQSAAPSQMQGVPQAAPTPQMGPVVPPLTPRPGAQLTAGQRLANIGLAGPGG